MEESGLHLEHPAAAQFRAHVLAGDWSKADHDLRALHELLRDSAAVAPRDLAEMKFVVLEQKYLEHLEAGRVLDALHVLRNELTPLQHDTPRVHRLSALMMCAEPHELQTRARWPGAGALSRQLVLQRVQAVLPPALMMAPGRLRALLAQAAAQQAARCRFHAAPRPPPLLGAAPAPIPFSLLADHHCSSDHFPIHPLQVLNEHCDEVWYCKWSPDGSKLASGSKDNTVMIWDFDPQAKRLSFRCADSDSTTISTRVAYSGESLPSFVLQKIIGGSLVRGVVLGVEPRRALPHRSRPRGLPRSLDMEHGGDPSPRRLVGISRWLRAAVHQHAFVSQTEQLHLKMTHSQEDSLTAVSWFASSDKFVCGGARGQFYQCNLEVTAARHYSRSVLGFRGSDSNGAPVCRASCCTAGTACASTRWPAAAATGWWRLRPTRTTACATMTSPSPRPTATCALPRPRSAPSSPRPPNARSCAGSRRNTP